jgi:hypothetical protein
MKILQLELWPNHARKLKNLTLRKIYKKLHFSFTHPYQGHRKNCREDIEPVEEKFM